MGVDTSYGCALKVLRCTKITQHPYSHMQNLPTTPLTVLCTEKSQ